jgi:hypothetical protein
MLAQVSGRWQRLKVSKIVGDHRLEVIQFCEDRRFAMRLFACAFTSSA